METPWLDDYQPRRWVAHVVKTDDLGPTLHSPLDFCVCSLESEAAYAWYRRNQVGTVKPVFMPDVELALGVEDLCDPYGVIDHIDERSATDGPCRLAQDWRGHPEGSLVFISCQGAPSYRIILVEKLDTV